MVPKSESAVPADEAAPTAVCASWMSPPDAKLAAATAADSAWPMKPGPPFLLMMDWTVARERGFPSWA